MRMKRWARKMAARVMVIIITLDSGVRWGGQLIWLTSLAPRELIS